MGLIPDGFSTTSSGELPIQLGSQQEFDRVISFIRNASFNEPTLLEMLNIRIMSDLSPQKIDVDLDSRWNPTLRLLVRLFLFTESVPRRDVEKLIPPEYLSSFLNLGILKSENFPETGDVYFSTIFLYPVEELILVSDRHNNPDGSKFIPPEDIVFPAINAGTLFFIRMIPTSKASEVLDLCAGSGVAAMILSPQSHVVVSSDVTERASYFAEFNKRLNSLSNVEVVTGDLYSGVEGRTFDRIVSHPPYVPTLSKTVIFRDGGETGELLLQRIIADLPRFLKPGGIFCAVTMGLDTREAKFEQRVHSWLGEIRNEFDIIFSFSDERTPSQFAQETASHQPSKDLSDVPRWEALFEREGVSSLVYGALALYRRTEAESSIPALVTRTKISPLTRGSSFEWAFKWHNLSNRENAPMLLASLKPRLPDHLKVRVTHQVIDSRLVPASFVLISEKPFAAGSDVNSWIVSAISGFDGSLSVADAYKAAKEAGVLLEGFPLENFIELVKKLIGKGHLEIADELAI